MNSQTNLFVPHFPRDNPDPSEDLFGRQRSPFYITGCPESRICGSDEEDSWSCFSEDSTLSSVWDSEVDRESCDEPLEVDLHTPEGLGGGPVLWNKENVFLGPVGLGGGPVDWEEEMDVFYGPLSRGLGPVGLGGGPSDLEDFEDSVSESLEDWRQSPFGLGAGPALRSCDDNEPVVWPSVERGDRPAERTALAPTGLGAAPQGWSGTLAPKRIRKRIP